MKKLLVCLLLLVSSYVCADFKYHKDGTVYDNCKVILFREYGALVVFESKIQDFCKGKEIIDIKITSNQSDSTTVIIVYR